jgi:Fur family ferric uptake transcriptional regulator
MSRREDVQRSLGRGQAFRTAQSETHHHHLVYRECGATVEVAARSVEQWAGRVAS